MNGATRHPHRGLGAGWLRPEFTAANVRALMTARTGGVSAAPFDSFNLRVEVGDDALAVAENRRRLAAACAGAEPRRLEQVHGTAVARLEGAGGPAVAPPLADASITTAAGIACEVQVADCLPVLFAHRDGRAVGASHAGWRGLAAGVLEATLRALCEATGAPAAHFEAWLGPCIGTTHFEVGGEVRAAFVRAGPGAAAHFVSQPDGKWRADLAGLARDRLRGAGVTALSGNDSSAAWCTYANPSRHFSFRRDGRTGRMAALVWRVD